VDRIGAFHCPIGAAYYDDEACIDCGMCMSTTPEEKVRASEKIRDYVKSHATRSGRASKIAVCGKGGAGKTTVVALLAGALSESGFRVLVVDADESNSGLGRMLGIPVEPRALAEHMYELERSVRNLERGPSGPAQVGVEDIPSDYLACGHGVKFISVGKITDPFQGCACSLSEATGKLVDMLRLKDNEVLIVDTEAGVESFGRGMERNVDTVLAVVEPSLSSIGLSSRIISMARGMGINRAGAVLNKMTSESMVSRITQDLLTQGVTVLGVVSYSQELAEEALKGEPVQCRNAMDEARALVTRLSNYDSGL
jgi:CO dehydrogenase maturation factor